MNPKQLKAMQEGRERARKARVKRAIRRVRAHRAWCEKDARIFGAMQRMEREGFTEDEIRAKVGSFPRMDEDAAGVTDADYKLAREAGAIV